MQRLSTPKSEFFPWLHQIASRSSDKNLKSVPERLRRYRDAALAQVCAAVRSEFGERMHGMGAFPQQVLF